MATAEQAGRAPEGSDVGAAVAPTSSLGADVATDTSRRSSVKGCKKCGKSFAGFGDTCPECRKAGSLGRQGTARACESCGSYFSGFGPQCDDCKAKGAAANIQDKRWDSDGVPLEETNVAGIGSDEDKAIRKSAAQTEPAWDGVGLAAGLWIWRIESFKVVPWPKEDFGSFYDGDSYIVLLVEEDPEHPGDLSKLRRHIFFWLGENTSTDEMGTAAYKTVELDDFFDGQATQHREVQGVESDKFETLFPKGLQYLKGGVDSGFRVTQIDAYRTRLYKLAMSKKRSHRIVEVSVQRQSLNHKDCFCLDKGTGLYPWYGDSASPFLKNATATFEQKLIGERGGHCKNMGLDNDDFWPPLGGQGEVTPADQVVDGAPEVNYCEPVLYKCRVDDKRQLHLEEVARKDIYMKMFDSKHVMILDGGCEIWVWKGDDAPEVEKRSAMPTAQNYLQMNGKMCGKVCIHLIGESSRGSCRIFQRIVKDCAGNGSCYAS